MKRWITPLATLAGTAVMIACASAQQAPIPSQGDDKPQSDKQAQKQSAVKKKPAADQSKKADAKKADAKKTDEAKGDAAPAEAGKADAPDEAEAKPLYNSLTVGYSTWNSSGNNSAMNQHGLVQGGFGLADLSILTPFDKGTYTAFDWKGNIGGDFGTSLTTKWGGDTSLVVNAHQFTSFDPSFGVTDPSRRKGVDATLEQTLGTNFGAFVSMKLDQNEHQFSAPIDPTDYVTRTVTLGAQKQVGEHTFGALYSESSFSDVTAIQPGTLTDRGQLRYAGNWGSRLSTMGTIGLTRIEQAGLPSNWIRDYAVSGVYDVSEDSSLGAHFGEQDLDLNAVQTAYVRKKLDSGLNFNARLGEWGLGFGFAHREEERVRADHSFVDVPAWNTYDVKLNGKLTHTYRLGVKGTLEDLSSAPNFLTTDPTLLYWSRKAKVQGKVSGGSEKSSEYASYTFQYRENSQREFSITTYDVAVGGSRVISPKLLGYAEFASEQYTTGGPNPIAPQLGSYLAPSETFMLGLDYTRNSREDLSLVLTSFYTQDQWGQQVALTYRLDLGKERNFLITYSPWLQRDRLYDVDTFTAPVWTMKLGFRF